MKIIAIGDTHGRRKWERIVEENAFVDKIVFIGDYFDTHEDILDSEEQRNFEEIVELKMRFPDQIVLLIGNHDFHYLNEITEHYSGYQKHAALRNNILLENAIQDGLMQMAFEADGFLFTHAGVTKNWCHNNGINVEHPAEGINELFGMKRSAFCFTGMNPYGDDITQTPIWVRPESLMQDAIENFTQVVGHTQMPKLIVEERLPFIFIDTLGTSGEYLSIENGKPVPTPCVK